MDYNPNNNQNFTENKNIGQPNGMPVYPYTQNLPQQNGAPIYVPVYAQPPVNFQDPKKEQKKKDKKILSKMGSSFGLSILLYVVLSFLLVGIITIISKGFPAIGALIDDSTGQYAFEGIGSVLILGVPFFISHLILKSKKYTGILPYGTPYNKKASIYLVMLMVPVVLVSSIVINLISFSFQKASGLTFESGLEDLSAKGPLEAVTLIFSLAIIPALVEEFCIRGVVLQPLRRYGDGFAIVMSAFVFSILHGNMVQIPYTVVAGIYFGYVCVITGSLWPSIVLHFINNMFSVVELIVAEYFSENVANYFTVGLIAVFTIIGIIGGIKYYKLNYKYKLKKGVTSLSFLEKIGAVIFTPTMIIALIIMIIVTATSVSTTG